MGQYLPQYRSEAVPASLEVAGHRLGALERLAGAYPGPGSPRPFPHPFGSPPPPALTPPPARPPPALGAAAAATPALSAPPPSSPPPPPPPAESAVLEVEVPALCTRFSNCTVPPSPGPLPSPVFA
ncbi:uncharacterized protein LOC131906503 [Peromyscus eremicus]|uniref:uncharacterized protein LOC131906503 n=1 Tax=Peromyscus eremicus TaxID=42410 RepID=UPI0027DABF14|nr:uncharacterized protein LOC131906503 [Peromyscus eremicus]